MVHYCVPRLKWLKGLASGQLFSKAPTTRAVNAGSSHFLRASRRPSLGPKSECPTAVPVNLYLGPSRSPEQVCLTLEESLASTLECIWGQRYGSPFIISHTSCFYERNIYRKSWRGDLAETLITCLKLSIGCIYVLPSENPATRLGKTTTLHRNSFYICFKVSNDELLFIANSLESWSRYLWKIPSVKELWTVMVNISATCTYKRWIWGQSPIGTLSSDFFRGTQMEEIKNIFFLSCFSFLSLIFLVSPSLVPEIFSTQSAHSKPCLRRSICKNPTQASRAVCTAGGR